MSEPSRRRYILRATGLYLLFGLGWIVLSDRILLVLNNPLDMAALSAAKGIFFVLASALALFMALRALPDNGPATEAPEPPASGPATRRRQALAYAFALLLSLCMLVIHQAMTLQGAGQPQFILFVLPIALSALAGGQGPGLLATGVALLGIDWLSQPMLHQAQAAPQDQFRWGLLLLDGLVLSLLSERLRRATARLRRSSRLLQSVVSGTSDAVFVKDLQGRYLLANAAASGFVDQTPATMLGQHDGQLFDADSARHLRERDLALMASASVQTHEERLHTRDGRPHVFLVTKGPVFDEQGQVSGVFGIARDVSAQKADQERLQASEAALREAQRLAGVGSWSWQLARDEHSWSDEIYRLYGRDPARGPAREPELQRYFSPESWQRLQQAAREAIEHGRSYEFDVELIPEQGPRRWATARAQAHRDAQGRVDVLYGTLQDITERKQFELALREASVVFESSHEGIMVVNPEGLITKVNPAFTRITGFAEDEVRGRSPRLLASGQQGRPFYEELWRALQQHDFWRGEIWNRRKNGELYVAQESISVLRDAQGQVSHYVGVFSDISQLKAHEAELDRVAHYDSLTGLPNRRLLSDRLEQSIRRSQRSGQSSAVCVLDLDGFKHINDRHGHTVGDQLLVALSERLQAILRAEDTLARVGGDEFVLLFADIGSPEECTLILDRVLQALRQPLALTPGLTLSASASIGVSLYPADDANPDTLLRHAEQAMVLAKQAGKNRYQLFDPESDRLAQARRRQLERLEQALEHDEFVLHYQPKVNLGDGAIIGAEALVRWNHPERGLLAPAEFLPQLSGSEQERRFGAWVIARALRQLAQWSRQGLVMQVSVNVSANHLLQPGFCEQLAQALAAEPGVAPAQLELEVLESAAIADMPQAVDVLTCCRALGVHFSLDDFGTGYSSLTYLRQLPVDTLKIDQSFVRNMLGDADDLAIVRSVIQLASVFQRQVIAEGVETLAHGALLRQMGCPCAQGYGIARPMPPEALPDWCADWQRRAPWQHL